FRYPSRVFMMLLGIGGCTALMVAGFGAKDSLAGVGDFQYDEISLYDVVVTLDAGKAGPQPGVFWEDWAEHAALAHREEIRLLNRDGIGKDTDLILADAAEITPLLSLHTRNGAELSWPGKGEVVITTKLSDTLGLRVGDSAVLRLSNGREQTVTVSGVCEYYVGHAVFASPAGFPDTARNYALIRVKDGEDASLRAARLRSAEGVNYVSLTRTERETLENSMASIDLLVLMLVFCSGALAFITLYNLTNINIMERIREVATVKVLGFTPHETAEYILNENLMLSFFGAIFGLMLGKLLHRFVMLSVNLDYMTYDVRIAALSYALSFVITVVFALLTNLFMRGKLEKVNMAESLKSVE
ncbi:MAG: ABC transporter permease, partial [Oscillospiraceae bacterium]|nr:ABC transporter permease [Oscillospiraceae bacterium]